MARWFLRLGAFARVIMFDKRGTGLSDPVSEVPLLDLRMDDARAVMDAAGSESAAFLGVSEGGALAALFAATYPQHCLQLVLYGAFARFPNAAEALKTFLMLAEPFAGLSQAQPRFGGLGAEERICWQQIANCNKIIQWHRSKPLLVGRVFQTLPWSSRKEPVEN